MSEYDVVVIGAGPGGYVAAIRAAQLGLRTAVVEKWKLGGVCLNVGCIPSKALLRNADLAHILRERTKEFGISFDNLNLDFSVAVKRSRQVSDRLVKGVGFLFRKNKIDHKAGTARLKDKNTVVVTAEDGSTEEVQAKNIILATGAYAAMIPGVEKDGEKIVDYWDAILQTRLPKSVVVIGGGPIGIEFSDIWASYGTDVTVVEMLPRILPLEDEEVARELTKVLEKRGFKLLTNHRVQGIEKTDAGVRVTVKTGEEEKVIEAEQALVAIGFKPNTKDIGLEGVGVTLDQRGFVQVDEHMRTNVDGIYAIGDVTGKLLLAHVASAMGIIAAETIANAETIELDYRMMPRAVYSHPNVASFGLTEEQAKEEGYDYRVGRFPFQANGKALGLGDYTGFVKILVDKQYGELLGAHMIGPDVSELLPELTLAQKWELTVEEIARNVHAHPTLSETLMEAAEDAEGHAINI